MHKKNLLYLTIIFAIKSLLLLFANFHSGVGLGPDEAQYWTWSQDLDFGYYSKPPGIAWQIWLGTALFGDNEWGVRSMPLLMGFFLPFFVYLMAARCALSATACFWSALAIALSPLGIFASYLAITDTGMIVFWTIACAYFAGKIERKEEPNFILVGLFIGLGALFKWPVYVFWLFILGSWAYFPYLVSWKILQGIAVSCLALLPSIYWNAHHDWVTFRHVFATLGGGHAKIKGSGMAFGNIWEFLGSQLALVSPILFILLIFSWKYLVKEKERLPGGVFFCGGVSFVAFASGALAAFFMKMQGNWVIFAYPSAFVLLGFYLIDGSAIKKRWLAAGIVFSVFASVLVFYIPFIQSHSFKAQFEVPYKINPFKHNIGWKQIESALIDSGYNHEKDFIFADKYQTSSIFSFYGPGQKRAYFFNLQGSRKNQFSFWPRMEEEQKGKKGFFVLVENIPHLNKPNLSESYLKQLSPYFEQVHYLGMKPLFKAYGEEVKGVMIFEGRGYRGNAPPEVSLY